jgi:hypothetical protein
VQDSIIHFRCVHEAALHLPVFARRYLHSGKLVAFVLLELVVGRRRDRYVEHPPVSCPWLGGTYETSTSASYTVKTARRPWLRLLVAYSFGTSLADHPTNAFARQPMREDDLYDSDDTSP